MRKVFDQLDSWCKRGLDKLIFAAIDPLPYAVARITIGFVSLINLTSLWPDRFLWFAENGALVGPARHFLTRSTSTNLFNWISSGETQVSVVLFLGIAFSIMVTIGALGRIAAVALWLILVSLSHQNMVILQGGDTLLRVCLFPLLFAPHTSVLSVDAWLKRREVKDPTPIWIGERTRNWPLTLIQIQISVMYLSTFLWKLKGSQWLDGTAVYTTSRLLDFQRFPVPFVFDNLSAIQAITWTTLYIELALGTIIWFRSTRYLVVGLGLMLHAGLEWTMNIPLFEVAAGGLLLTFVDGEDLRRWITRGQDFVKDRILRKRVAA